MTVNDKAPYLELNSKKASAYGFGGCNRFFGSYETSGNSLKFGAMGATRMACPEGMDEEQELFTALGATTRYEIHGSKLMLFAGDTRSRASKPVRDSKPTRPSPPMPKNLRIPVADRAPIYPYVRAFRRRCFAAEWQTLSLATAPRKPFRHDDTSSASSSWTRPAASCAWAAKRSTSCSRRCSTCCSTSSKTTSVSCPSASCSKPCGPTRSSRRARSSVG